MVGANRAGEVIALGRFKLEGGTLLLETMSLSRAERGRAMVEALAGEAIAYRGTVHEDMERLAREAIRERVGGDERPASPPEIPRDVAEDIALDALARHYHRWVDEPVPALGGKTPRDAATDATLRPAVEELVRGLEGMYEGALRDNGPAYDPSWLWAELGLAPAALPPHPPPLAHERWAEAAAGWSDACRAAAARRRAQPGFDDASTVAVPADLANDLEIRRIVRAARDRHAAGEAPATGGDLARLERQVLVCVSFEMHLRKTFWVDEGLAYLLGRTETDVTGDRLRLPFACFALAFTDRGTLSLAERLLAGEQACPLAGHILRVATVYLWEEQRESGRAIRVAFAFDALGADLPHLVEHEVALSPEARVEIGESQTEREAMIGEGGSIPHLRPLAGLLRVVINSVLYATSAGVEPEVRPAPVRRAAARRGGCGPVFSSEEVFFLPGTIEISRLRRLQELERAPSGRQLLHRFMVRGHWRRPPVSWSDQRMRWIEPYWKGPELAAVIERAYALEP